MVARCKKCEAIIYWEKNENDRWTPLNLDGSSHFDTCPYAKEFRGRHFKDTSIDYTKPIRPKDQKGLEDY